FANFGLSARSLIATRAPQAASRRTVASPMPEAPPVTSATRVVRSAVIMRRNTLHSAEARDGACARWHAYPTIVRTRADLNLERKDHDGAASTGARHWRHV